MGVMVYSLLWVRQDFFHQPETLKSAKALRRSLASHEPFAGSEVKSLLPVPDKAQCKLVPLSLLYIDRYEVR